MKTITIVLILIFGCILNDQNLLGQSNCSCSLGKNGVVDLLDPNSSLNIRSRPSISSKIIGNIPDGEEIFICHNDNDSVTGWFWVDYNHKSGYVSSQYINFEYSLRNRFIIWGDHRVFYGELLFSKDLLIYEIDDHENLKRTNNFSEIISLDKEHQLEKIISMNHELVIIDGVSNELDFENSIIIDTSLSVNSIIDFNFKKGKYTISCTGNVTENAILEYSLHMNDNDSNEVVDIGCIDKYNWPGGGYEGLLDILLAGDFNNDGQMDVIYKISNHYASVNYIMMLSTSQKGIYEKTLLETVSTC